jgi:general secretion pathway protein A
MDYATYWGLAEKPFEETCNTRFFFESEDHREALDRMVYIVNDRNMNMGMLTGEVGSGKTITKNVLQGSLPRHNFEVVGFDNSNFSFNDLLYDVIRRLTFRDPRIAMTLEGDLPPRDDKYLLVNVFRERLDKLVYEDKRHLVLVFDEAQQMTGETLDEVKNLTNISSETHSYLTVFFVGQPELRETVRLLRQVDQRIFLRFHLNNLDYNGTVKYVQHRLRVAGLQSEGILSSLAYERVFRSTGGVPREINRLCKLAMTFGAAHDLKEITREDVEVVLLDLEKHS